NYLNWDIATSSAAVQQKNISPVEVTNSVLQQISSGNEDLNAYITVTSKEALAQAKKAEEEIQSGKIKGPLHGIPLAIKDNIYTTDIKTTRGSEIYKDYIPKRNATVVDRLRDAGAIMVGKTNTHQ